ncbi:nucleotidyl transferase AbiEii/AbiGii toxin family protein [candidate division KSB1 bacterium]|nr:nucleotidyl transferase AbiEii/AbiGii toxin family protein [candidate division KSB1 bacterium]
MKQKQIKNLGASVRNRLLNVAKRLSMDFNRILLLYFQERFLYRLAQSKYKNSFVLKGGVLLYGRHQMKARPTKDIDFLATKINNQPESFARIINEIITTAANDGVFFDPASISFESIAQRAPYKGIRLKITAHLDTARQNLQLDFGFGDVVVPHPIPLEYPVLLEPERIEISAYSWDSVVAEKFEACVKLSDLNSRMKDFHDIHFLLNNHNFAGKELRTSILATFQNRRTDLSNAAHIFSETFYSHPDKQKQWSAFLRTIHQPASMQFSEVVQVIKTFLSPVIEAILAKTDFNDKWKTQEGRWIL